MSTDRKIQVDVCVVRDYKGNIKVYSNYPSNQVGVETFDGTDKEWEEEYKKYYPNLIFSGSL